MNIVIIGGTGQIGTKVIANLTQQGHNAVAASPSTGVDTVTGEGLDAALAGADVVVDVTNNRDWDDESVMRFFTTSTANLLAAEAKAGVRHHIAVTIVGAQRMTGSGYMRAKLAQEELIVKSDVPSTIIRATQFFEFVPGIGQASQDDDGRLHVSPVLFQPIAADDVAQAVTEVALGEPRGRIEIAGPDRVRIVDAVRQALPDADVVEDPAAGYFGATVDDTSLVPEGEAWIGKRRFLQMT